MPRKPSEFEHHPVSFEEARDHGLLRGVCRHVVDGDTHDYLLDLGFLHYAYETVRLQDIDTPEIYRPRDEAERERGFAAKRFVEGLILDRPVLVRSYKGRTSFGRFAAEVYHSTNENGPVVLSATAWQSLAATLRAEGYAGA